MAQFVDDANATTLTGSTYEVIEQGMKVAGAAIEEGQVVALDTNTPDLSKVVLADGNGTGTFAVYGVAMEDAASGASVKILIKGITPHLRTDDSLAKNALMYVSDTAGLASSTAGTADIIVAMGLGADTEYETSTYWGPAWVDCTGTIGNIQTTS